MINSKIFVFVAFVFLLQIAESQKLIMVQQLFRHGARYPVYPRKQDGSEKYTFDERSMGELTTNGKKMHYLLGKQMYKLYWSQLFAGTQYQKQYNQSKFYIKSTDVNRTIESVQSHLGGMLEDLPQLQVFQNMTQFSNPQWPGIQAEAGPVFPKAIKFHPIAIHVQKVGTSYGNTGDFLRTYAPDNCPNQNKWQIQNRHSDRVKDLIKNENFTRALQALSKQFNKTIGFWDAPAYYDNYLCAKYLGKSFPPIFQHQEYIHPLDYIHTIQMYVNLYMEQKQIRATATGFFNATVHNIKTTIADRQQPQWIIYSAHDTTVGNMLAAMNMTNVQCIYQGFLNNDRKDTKECVTQYPQYTANIIFEVYQTINMNTLSHFFKIRYNGEYRQIPFCQNKMQCDIHTLYQWYQSFKDENFLSTCGVQDTQAQTYFTVAVVQFGILISIFIIVAVGYLKKSMARKEVKQHQNKQILRNEAQQEQQKPSIKYQKDSPNEMVKESLLSNQEKKYE